VIAVKISIRKSQAQDLDDLISMGAALWPEEDEDDLGDLFNELLDTPRQVTLVAVSEGSLVGFANGSIRRDYVEGSSSSPVGYLEGIFTEPEVRRRGVAKAMVNALERWAASEGCTEMGSDAYEDNVESHVFHAAVGFEEAGRLVAFVKQLEPVRMEIEE
jgi:aminoglycoside 6'-N-acetyltransferase I